ncbi:hypothetical protein ACETK8_14895 [Brevundimonas staleyi]|uniref:Uncharacterized protein n=1 Tax=Brevundimonas staleyi TaxID=74326 RepID=A0ABW0FVN2_9CAUL
MAKLTIGVGRIAQGLATVALASSLAAAVALSWPQTDFALMTSLAGVHDARAQAFALQAVEDVSARDAAGEATVASLRQTPGRATSWLRLAYLDSLDPGGMGEAGNRALATSYVVAPYGPDDTRWRMAFVFNHWDKLSHENKLSALDELRVARARIDVRALKAAVTNKDGRIALAVMTM